MTRQFAGKKVVFVGNFGLWNKATISARTVPMAREIVAAGHLAVIMVPPWDAPGMGGRIEVSHDIPVRNTHVPEGIWRHPGSTFNILRAVLAERPDVVVCVKPKAYAGLLALLLGQLSQRRGGPIRLVVDTDDWEGTGGWSEMGGTPRVLRPLIALHEQLSIRVADHVLVASRELQRLVASSGVPLDRTTYVPNGTWEGAAGWPKGNRTRGRGRLGLRDEPVLLLYSRLFEFELGRVVHAVGQILESIPRAQLLVVGVGLAGEEHSLRRALNDMNVGHRSHLVGWVNRPDLPDMLAAADVAIVPLSNTRVNQCRCSVKILDLMLSAVPIVADRVGQVTEFLRDQESGVLIDSANVDAMSHAVIELFRDPVRMARIAQSAQKRARHDLTWHHHRTALVRAIVGP